MQKVTNPLIWLARFRHRKGYGVHSPFAFRFITDVIYESHPYYGYALLDRGLPLSMRLRVRRGLHLLLRIANHLQPCDEALEHLGEHSVLLLDNLHLHRDWFKSIPSVVSFDLYDFGIAFFDKQYNKQYYKVNF